MTSDHPSVRRLRNIGLLVLGVALAGQATAQGATADPRGTSPNARGGVLAAPATGPAGLLRPSAAPAAAPIDRAQAPSGRLAGRCPDLQAEAPQPAKVAGAENLAEAYWRMGLSPPMLPEGKTDVVAPGQKLVVMGRCFGAVAGQVKVVLQTPERQPGQSAVAAAAQAPVILPTVQQWSDERIELLVPGDVSGVAPGPAALVVVRADGRSSSAQGVTFYPAWESGPLAAEIKVLSCAEPQPTAASRCDVNQRPVFKGGRLQERGAWFLDKLGHHADAQLRAIHYQDGDWPRLAANVADGVDRYGLRLPPWTAAWVSQDPDKVDVRFWTGNDQEGRASEQAMRELPVRPVQSPRRWSAAADHEIAVPWSAPGAGRWLMYELKVMAIWPVGMGSPPGSTLANRAAERSAGVDLRPAALSLPGPAAPRAATNGTPRELKQPQDLAGLTDTEPVRFEGRITTLKALRERATTQVLRSGTAGASQATWSRTVRGWAGSAFAGDLPAANTALRRSVDEGGSVAQALLKGSGGAVTTQRCNGVDYTGRATPGKANLTGPQVTSLKQSHIGPGGAVVLNGLCFGASPGRVRLIGNFRGGQLMLATPVWRHDVVYAEIPSLMGVASHGVVVQLLDARGVVSNELPATWDAPPPPLQPMEVDSARVWELVQCDLRAPAEGVCQSGAQRLDRFDNQTIIGLMLDAARTWQEGLPPTAIGALHRRIDLNGPVEPFQGRDVYRLRAPADCVAEKTFWSQSANAPATGFTATHLDSRTVAVDWRADFCIQYGWALDHDWACTGNYTSRKTVIACPVGTVLP